MNVEIIQKAAERERLDKACQTDSDKELCRELPKCENCGDYTPDRCKWNGEETSCNSSCNHWVPILKAPANDPALFPKHPMTMGKYEEIAAEIGRLVDSKQQAYGDSFHLACKIIAVLYPNGIRPEQYQDFTAVIRIIDKLFRIATDKGAFGESPWHDITGYGTLMCG